jgi:hypothetical protein
LASEFELFSNQKINYDDTKHLNHAGPYQKKGLLIPVLTAIVFSFCTKVVAQEKRQQRDTTKKPLSIFKYYQKNHFLKLKTESGKVVATKKILRAHTKEKHIVPPVILEKTEHFTTEN